tara:strand:- start:186 stop:389 length:204 start_codon:yes stop_codon:yes gene_type:complete
MSKKKDPQEIKKEELKVKLEAIVKQFNEAIAERNKNDELAKRCLGGIEVLQKLIGEENEEVKAEIVE